MHVSARRDSLEITLAGYLVVSTTLGGKGWITL